MNVPLNYFPEDEKDDAHELNAAIYQNTARFTSDFMTAWNNAYMKYCQHRTPITLRKGFES